MEAVIICGLLVFLLMFNSGMTLWLVMSGNFRWRPPGMAHIWLCGFALAFVVSSIWFGLPTILLPALVILALFGVIWVVLGWLDRRFTPGPRRATLDSRLAPHAGQTPPPWIAQAVQHGVKGWTLGANGKLARQPSAASRVMDWLNKPLD